MSEFKFRAAPPALPISFDADKCIGCLKCMEVCQIDLFLPPEVKGQPPVVAFPDECWYCGCCVMECPRDAIQLHHPLMNRTRFVTKESLLKNKGEE